MNNYKFSEYTANYISGVMSLRKPQRKSLEILDDLVGDIDLNKSLDKDALKDKAHNNYPIFTDYDRAFPSFTFALATGVGKTRLMGTFITYLYTRKNIKNFLVVAPSLTIYNKLINDFANSSSSKYVFNGVGCFDFGHMLLVVMNIVRLTLVIFLMLKYLYIMLKNLIQTMKIDVSIL